MRNIGVISVAIGATIVWSCTNSFWTIKNDDAALQSKEERLTAMPDVNNAIETPLSPQVMRALQDSKDLFFARMKSVQENKAEETKRLDEKLALLHDALSPSDQAAYSATLKKITDKMNALPEPHLVLVKLTKPGDIVYRGATVALPQLKESLVTEKTEKPGTKLVVAFNTQATTAQERRVAELTALASTIGIQTLTLPTEDQELNNMK